MDIKPLLDPLDKIVDKLKSPSEAASTVLLMFIVIGMIALLFRLVGQRSADGDQPKEIKPQQRRIDQLEEELEITKNELHDLRTNPPYSAAEKIYFNVNGIANSGLILAISLLLWEFIRVSTIVSHMSPSQLGQKPNQLLSVVEAKLNAEIGALMAVLAGAFVVSALILIVARVQNGRSLDIINRAFLISLFVTILAFSIFVTFISAGHTG